MNDTLKLFFTFLLIINVVTSFLFVYDKVAAIKGKKRIPELILHTFEFFGGVFFVVLLIPLINHKNRKRSYYRITYIFMILWMVVIWRVFSQN